MGIIIKAIYLYTTLYAVSIVTAQDTSVVSSLNNNPPSLNSDTILDTLTPKGEERHFFRLQMTTCDHTVTPGNTCANCRQTMICFENNKALVTRCPFFLPYCNNGLCSTAPSSLCSTASTSTSSTSSTSTTTTPTTTTIITTIAP